jgi:hypothetical protein
MSNPEPLWKRLPDALGVIGIPPKNYAPVIRAIAVWLRERHPLDGDLPSYVSANRVGNELLAEADRAEAGE